MTVELLVVGAAVWTGIGPVSEAAAVGVRNGRIAYLGPANEAPEAGRVVAGDWFLMPAYVDWHVHIAFGDPAEIVRNGVTRVRDLAWPSDVVFPWRDASLAPDAPGPRIDCCGPMLTCPGGYCSRASWAPTGTAWTVTDASAAADAVATLAGRGAAAIKVALNSVAGPTLDNGLLRTVCDAAYRQGLPVTAHTEGPGQAERALQAGVTELAHCPWTERLSASLVDDLAAGCRIVTTLDMLGHGRWTPELECAIDNLSRLHAAGAEIRYGTDLGSGPLPNGIHVREVRHMAAAGMRNDEIIRALTSGPLLFGAPADLVALSADPLEDITALGQLALVLRDGRVRREPATD